MVKRVMSLLLCILMVFSASVALAGGAPRGPAPCGPAPYGPGGGNPCAYWGDAPFPGMCGGVVALPFLVVGSLLGGNTVGPYGPVPGPGYNCAPPPPPLAPCGGPVNPPCGPVYGTAYTNASVLSNSALGGLPCFDICTGLLGSLTAGTGLGFGL